MPQKRFVQSYKRRAVADCLNAMHKGRLSQRHVDGVLKYDDIDVSPLEPFLEDGNEFIRAAAVKLVGERGDRKKLVSVLLREEDIDVLSVAMKYVAKDSESIEELLFLLDSDDGRIRSQAIALFRRAGRADCLFPLMFHSDDALVARIRRHIEEADNGKKCN